MKKTNLKMKKLFVLIIVAALSSCTPDSAGSDGNRIPL